MRVTIVSPTASTNALGRALSLADLCAATNVDVRVVAPCGPVWHGAAQHTVAPELHRHGQGIIDSIDRTGDEVIWAIKPHKTSWRLALELGDRAGRAPILDVDDDEAALSRQFSRSSTRNRLRLHPLHPLHPRNVDRVLTDARRTASRFTSSTEALARALELPTDTVHLPHPRPVPDSPSALTGDQDIGFLGTPRGHKGIEVIVSVIRADPARRLHVFRGAHRWWAPVSQQVVEHATDEPLDAVYRQISLVLLPQDRTSGGQLQLPAKLLDAMRYGVPVIASNTPAMTEVIGQAGITINDWTDASALNTALAYCRREGRKLGDAARHRFIEEYAYSALTPRLRSLLTAT